MATDGFEELELTDEEYRALQELFHHANRFFKTLPVEVLLAYNKRLYQGAPIVFARKLSND